MANTKSAKKMIRVIERRTMRNRAVKSAMRTYIRKAEREIAAGHLEEARAAVVRAVSAVDKAAEKGVIHKNNASRRKSRLMTKLHRAETAAAAAAAAPPAAAPTPTKRVRRAKKVGTGG